MFRYVCLFIFSQRNTLSRSKNLHICLTGEEEEAALNRTSNGLQFDYIHRLANVNCAGHAPKGAPNIFGHLLNGEHLQQLIKYIRETVQQCCLRGKTKKAEKDICYTFMYKTSQKHPIQQKCLFSV